MTVIAETGPAAIRALRTALADLGDGLLRWRVWSALAWEELRERYHRTLFGAAWITLSFAAFTAAQSIVFSKIANQPISFFAVYVATGFLAWQFCNGVVVEACDIFRRSDAWIRGMRLPLSLFVLQAVARQLFAFLLASLVVAGVLLLFRWPLSPAALMLVPAVAAYAVNAAWVTLALGVICARHRDIGQLAQTAMRILFFLTPIIWTPAQVGQLEVYVWLNPFTHYVAILRAPIMDGSLAGESWFVVLAITLAGWALALGLLAAFRRRIVFWI